MFLHPFEDVRISRERQVNIGVPEPFLDDLDVHSLGEQRCSAAVPKGIQFMVIEAGYCEDRFEVPLGDVPVMQRRAQFGRENEVISFVRGPELEDVFGLTRLVFLQLISQHARYMPVGINYDTMVVEARELQLFPDVYEKDVNTFDNLKQELESYGIGVSKLPREKLEEMLANVDKDKKFIIPLASLMSGKFEDGKTEPLIPSGLK